MKVKEIMNKHPACCGPDTKLSEVARTMVECDCGAIPVVEDVKTRKPLIGILTDRDITCRIVAKNINPLEKTAKDCMSTPVASVHPDDPVESVLEIMEIYQIRRVPVVDQNGVVKGIVTQAHLAKKLPEDKIGELLKDVSGQTGQPSAIPTSVR